MSASHSMRWFGAAWEGAVCRWSPATETPVGSTCGGCGSAIREGDRGILMPFAGAPDDPPWMAYHLACLLESLGISR